MALTSIELIDVLRQEARRIEQGEPMQQSNRRVNQILNEIRNMGLQEADLEQAENQEFASRPPAMIAPQLHRLADALEKQLLAMLDLPVDIAALKNAA